MGCWNKTCGITNLPIFHGDEVVVFLLVQSPYTSSHNSYSSGLWCHIPLPIYGKYDDYGWVSPHPGQEWKLELFKKGLPVVRKEKPQSSGYNRYPKLKDTPFESFESLGNSIHGEVFDVTVNSYNGNFNATLSEFFVHKSTFDELKGHFDFDFDASYRNFEAFLDWRIKDEAVAENIIELDDLLDEVDRPEDEKAELVARMKKAIRMMGMSSVAETNFHESLTPVPDYAWSYPGYSAINFWYASGQGSVYGWVTSSFVRSVRDNVNIPTTEQLDGYVIVELMQKLRKQFCPQSGEGSQDGIDNIHKAFSDTYLKRITEYKNKYGYDDEEEEEGEEENT